MPRLTVRYDFDSGEHVSVCVEGVEGVEPLSHDIAPLLCQLVEDKQRELAKAKPVTAADVVAKMRRARQQEPQVAVAATGYDPITNTYTGLTAASPGMRAECDF